MLYSGVRLTFIFIGLLLLCFSFISCFEELQGVVSPSFEIATEGDIGTVKLGLRELAFRMTNISKRPSKILGIRETCQVGLCIQSTYDGPVSVSPGEVVIYTCNLKIVRPGPFTVEIIIYLEDEMSGVRDQLLTVTGIAIV